MVRNENVILMVLLVVKRVGMEGMVEVGRMEGMVVIIREVESITMTMTD